MGLNVSCKNQIPGVLLIISDRVLGFLILIGMEQFAVQRSRFILREEKVEIMIKLIITDNYDEMSKQAFLAMKEVFIENEHPVLGLATGSTPVGLYKEMIQFGKDGYSYKNCTTFNLDEYIGLDKNHEQTYWTFMHENLLDHIDVPAENIHIPEGDTEDPEKACKDYEKSMEKYDVDIQLLGLGANGHIGFNEPGTAIDSLTHVVTLTEKTRKDNARFFDNLDQVPKQAVTMGIGTIMRAKKILVVANGENKADAVYRLLRGDVTTEYPCSALREHKDLTIVVDKAAASKLFK